MGLGLRRSVDRVTSISRLLDRHRTLSFEFFPPKTEAAALGLRATVDTLEKLEPDFVSITYGAGGTTRGTTRDTVIEMCLDRDFPAMPHLTCVGHSHAEIHDLVDDYQSEGVHNVLALAGDLPADGSPNPGDFRYASELVEVLRERTEMCIGVAAFPEVHPRSESRESDRRHLAEKLSMADFAITQFFFDPDVYFRMVDELAALGCDKPIIPGVIPVLNPDSVKRFADMNGSKISADLWASLERASDPDELVEIAVDAATDMISTLIEGGAPGIHIYSLNRADAVVRICDRIDLRQGL